MAQFVKYFPCEHEELSLILSTHIKKEGIYRDGLLEQSVKTLLLSLPCPPPAPVQTCAHNDNSFMVWFGLVLYVQIFG